LLNGCSKKGRLSVLKQIPYSCLGGTRIISPPPSPSPPLTELIASGLSISFSDNLEINSSKFLFAISNLIFLSMILKFKFDFCRLILIDGKLLPEKK